MYRAVNSLIWVGLVLSSCLGVARADSIVFHAHSSPTYTFFHSTAYPITFAYTDYSTTVDLAPNVPTPVTFSHGTFETTEPSVGVIQGQTVLQQLYVGSASQTLNYSLTLTGARSTPTSAFNVAWAYNSPSTLQFNTSQWQVTATNFARTQPPLDAPATENVQYAATFTLSRLGIPEPASLTMLAMGALAAGCTAWIAHRRRRSRASE